MNTNAIRPKAAIRSLVIALAAAVLPVAAATTSADAAPTCGIRWGSTAKSATPMVAGPVTGVRAGRHACYDRLVIDLRGRAPGYTVRYVDAVHTEGAGTVVPLRGGARLEVVVKAPVTTAAGTAAYRPANPREAVQVTGWSTLRQVAYAGSFEGQTTFGVGVRARLPFRAFTIQDSTGSRLVVDVAHRW
jgi:hypothetical protein